MSKNVTTTPVASRGISDLVNMKKRIHIQVPYRNANELLDYQDNERKAQGFSKHHCGDAVEDERPT